MKKNSFSTPIIMQKGQSCQQFFYKKEEPFHRILLIFFTLLGFYNLKQQTP